MKPLDPLLPDFWQPGANFQSGRPFCAGEFWAKV